MLGKRVFSVLLFLGLVALLYGVWQGLSFLLSPPGEESQKIVFEVKPGESLYSISRNLKEKGMLNDIRKFVWLARLQGKSESVKTGEYKIHAGMTPSRLLKEITEGVSVGRRVTIQEGINIYDIADILEKNGMANKGEFLILCHDQEFIHSLLGERLRSLEGYLFPETYQFTKYAGVRKIIEVMVRRFLKVYDETIPKAVNFNRHQIVTFASLIEKETGAPEERPQISSVFHNRLKKKMRLQTDPTILYGLLVSTGKMLKNIKKKHITQKNPYNTYTIHGLPPGPIANPGRESLRAVVYPDKTEYLYFVSRNDGTHYFSKTYEEHNKAVRKFQLDRSARKNKSWRDLKKNTSP